MHEMRKSVHTVHSLVLDRISIKKFLFPMDNKRVSYELSFYAPIAGQKILTET